MYMLFSFFLPFSSSGMVGMVTVIVFPESLFLFVSMYMHTCIYVFRYNCVAVLLPLSALPD
jgi:hypothetical protein